MAWRREFRIAFESQFKFHLERMSSSISQVALNAALASVDAIKERLASVSDELAANPGLIVLFLCVFVLCFED